jgi:hypothetical protein
MMEMFLAIIKTKIIKQNTVKRPVEYSGFQICGMVLDKTKNFWESFHISAYLETQGVCLS